MQAYRFLAGMALAAVAGSAVTAQTPMKLTDAPWQIVRVGACNALMNRYTFALVPADFASKTQVVTGIKWTGACDREGLITGKGVLAVSSEDRPNRILWRMEYRGVAKSGIMTGKVEIWRYISRTGKPPLKLDPESYDSNGTYYVYNFDGGCFMQACKPADGAALLKQYRSTRTAAAPAKR